MHMGTPRVFVHLILNDLISAKYRMQIIQEKFELNILKASLPFSVHRKYLENDVLYSYQIKINPYFRPRHR